MAKVPVLAKAFAGRWRTVEMDVFLIKPSMNDKHLEKVGFALAGADSNTATTVFDNFSRVR